MDLYYHSHVAQKTERTRVNIELALARGEKVGIACPDEESTKRWRNIFGDRVKYFVGNKIED